MPKVPETIVPTFSEKETEKLLAQPNKHSNEGFRDFAILLTLIDTGVRLSELASLKASDIDYEQNLFRVMGKGSRERYVPYGRRVAILHSYALWIPHLFLSSAFHTVCLHWSTSLFVWRIDYSVLECQ